MSQYATLIAASGAATGDNTAGYGPALDSVMRLLGLAVASANANPTIPTGQESDALLLTRYYALDWLLGALAVQVDVTDGKDKWAGSQLTKQVTALLDRAKAQVPSQYAIDPGDFAFGRLQLDFLEPEYYPVATPPNPYP